MYLSCVIGFLCLLYNVSCVNGYESKPCVNITDSKTVCTCSGYTTDCSRKNLTFIPEIPAETKILNMSGNSLTHIKKSSFTNISNVSLTSLDLSKNRIMRIDKSSFAELTNLQKLNLSLNHFPYLTLGNVTYDISDKLKFLILEGLKIQHCPYPAIKNLKHTRISTLSLKNNSIGVVKGASVFPYLTYLEELDLSFNSIHSLDLRESKKLEKLSLSSNDLSELPEFCSNGAAYFPNLGRLFLDDNCIGKLSMEHMNCLSNLKLLNISATRIKVIAQNSFAQLKSLSILTMEWTPSLTYIDDYAFNSSTLRKVYIRSNRVEFKHENVKSNTFLKLCPHLENLDLSGNVMGMLVEKDWENIFKYLLSLTYLDIGFSQIMYLPKAIPMYLNKLTSLHVANTGVHYIPKDYFLPLTSLTKLIMADNKFTTISAVDFPPSFTNHLTYINLAFNPYICDCKLLWFLQFVKQNKQKMAFYPKYYVCFKKDSKYEKIRDFHIDIKSCLLKQQTTEMIKCTCGAIILLLLVLSAVYRLRWNIRYILYVCKFHRRNCSNFSVNGIRHLHDIYISSSDRNFNVVYNHIVLGLEGKGFSVHFPERDAMPGALVIHETLEHMDRSKYVILCLSNAYAQDNWCEFEAYMALQRSITEGNDDSIVIVIVLDEIETLNMTKIINKLFRTADYLMWDDNPETNDLFWRKLERMLSN